VKSRSTGTDCSDPNFSAASALWAVNLVTGLFEEVRGELEHKIEIVHHQQAAGTP
jgi:hypothetical protein